MILVIYWTVIVDDIECPLKVISAMGNLFKFIGSRNTA